MCLCVYDSPEVGQWVILAVKICQRDDGAVSPRPSSGVMSNRESLPARMAIGGSPGDRLDLKQALSYSLEFFE